MPKPGKNALKFKEKLSKENNESQDNTKKFNILSLRNDVENAYNNWLSKVKLDKNIKIKKEELKCNGRKVMVTIYSPADNLKQLLPGVIFHPGGGLALDMAHHHAHICSTIAKTSGTIVVCVQPCLSPENKFPEIFADAYSATKYFSQNAIKYGINKNRFINTGYSMGGTLATLITLKACDDQGLLISGQVIISGVLNIGNPPKQSGEDFMFSPEVHEEFIKLCLPEGLSISGMSTDSFYCPMLHKNLSKLPSTRLISGDCDAFLDDSKIFEKKLKKQEVNCELSINKGQIHNTLLLYPRMGDSENPAIIAGNKIKELVTA